MLTDSSPLSATPRSLDAFPEQTGGELYRREFMNIVSNSQTPDFIRAFVSALNQCTPADGLKYSERIFGLAELRYNELGPI